MTDIFEQDPFSAAKVSLQDEFDLPDQNPKYDMTEEQLAKANEKIGGPKTETEELPKEAEEKRPTIKVGKKIIHVRTDQEYDDIWDSFLMNVAEDFEEYMGYGVEKIKEIGIRKFIDAMDWVDALDVYKYKSDTLHIVPCVHCGQEFADVEENFGLCEACELLYDLTYFEQVMAETNAEVARITKNQDARSIASVKVSGIISFMRDKEFREKFLRSVLDARDASRALLSPTKEEKLS